MAATNYTPIQLYFSTTASAAPTAANLAQGELAINITDGKLYYEDGSGVVQVIATKGAGTIGGSTTQIQYNNSGALAGSAAMVFNNSTNVTTLTTLNLTNALGAIYGGTAQSTYTQGDFLYASAANTLSKLGIGANTYILTSTGSIPQWVAPSSIAVLTATNLAGGLAGSVPYQSALDTTTFLAIGAANRVMTSTGTAPQWVTSLTGLTGVSSSSITNTSLTSGRVVVSTTAGLQADDADLTFDGTTLSAGGFSTVGLSTLVKTVKIGDSSFNGVAVFAAATPAKLYMGTGTVTDVTSAISATNAIGAIASLGITPIAATNTSVTYTNAATLYIAGAPSAGTNVLITNPYALYVAAGASYLGGAVTIGGNTAITGTLSATGAIQTGSGNSTASGLILGYFGASSYGAIWSTGVTPSTTNFSFLTNATSTVLNGTTGVTFQVGNVDKVAVSSTGLAVTGILTTSGDIGVTYQPTVGQTSGIRIGPIGASTQAMIGYDGSTGNLDISPRDGYSIVFKSKERGTILATLQTSGNFGIGDTATGKFLAYQAGSIQNYQGAYGSSGTFQTGTGSITLGGGANPRGIGVLINANRAASTTLTYGANYETFGLIAVANVGTGGGYGTTGIAGYAESDGQVIGLRADAKTTSSSGASPAYGLYVGSVTGSSTNYGVYVNDTAASNYFGGSLLVGTAGGGGYKIATAVAASGSFQNAITMTNASDSDLSVRIRTNETSFVNSGAAGALTFATNSTERVRISAAGLLTATYGSYADPSLTSSGSNGLQITLSASYNDNSAHQVAFVQNRTGVIYIRAGNLSALPFYPNGGGGVAYQWTVLNPQTGTWGTGSGPTVNFTENGASPNSYSVVFSGGGGSFTITRTGGSQAYSVFLQLLADT